MTGYIIWQTASHAKRMHFVSCRGVGTGETQAPGCGVTCSSPGAHWDMIQIVLKTGSTHLTSTCKTHAKRSPSFQSFCQPQGGTSLWESLKIGTKTYNCHTKTTRWPQQPVPVFTLIQKIVWTLWRKIWLTSMWTKQLPIKKWKCSK